MTGKLIWSRWLGNARDSGPLGIPDRVPLPLGTPTTGGSITTRGAFATPMSYVSPKSGRQFVVVAAGGSKGPGQTGGATLFAYALPRARH